MRAFRFLLLAAVLAALAPQAVLAQQQDAPPETRLMTLTTFTVSGPQSNQRFNEYVDMIMVPQLQEDPHVLSFRLARHYWGTSTPNVWLITEYASLEELQKSEEFQDRWFQERFPEGSPQREEANRAFQEGFGPYFADHVDNIMTVNMRRAK